MGDGLKLSKDKRHRSFSSLSGVAVEGTRSERKLDVRASIPEVDDHFTLAEARCNVLQDKLELIKGLKKKRKLKKRSMTRVSEPPSENLPLISVRTQPKKNLASHTARQRRLQLPLPTHGYLDSATVEQHRMIETVQQLQYQPTAPNAKKQLTSDRRQLGYQRSRRACADGDTTTDHTNVAQKGSALEMAYGEDDGRVCSDSDNRRRENSAKVNKKSNLLLNAKPPAFRRRHVPKETPLKEGPAAAKPPTPWRSGMAPPAPLNRRKQPPARQTLSNNTSTSPQVEDSPIMELFNNDRDVSSPVSWKHQEPRTKKKGHELQRQEEDNYTREDGNVQEVWKGKESPRHSHRTTNRSRRYEMPTVASQMKQNSQRYYYGTHSNSNIPFVVSKSTAPSHNIGVNIQQVLNGIKVQQPLSGIPLTIAHHMGLGHVPYSDTNTAQQPSLDTNEINVIRVGQRMLRLPSKYISYNRMLNLYREGEGVVPRFLRAISRPHYLYTSMYNLTTRDDFEGAEAASKEKSAKQNLAEYASLYREYERLDKSLKDGCGDAEVERRRDHMARELAAREELIRRIVQDSRGGPDPEPTVLRTSLSTAEQSYRFSTFKLNAGDGEQ